MVVVDLTTFRSVIDDAICSRADGIIQPMTSSNDAACDRCFFPNAAASDR